MADREYEVISRDTALKIKEDASKIPGEVMERINDKIKDAASRCLDDVVFGKNMVQNNAQWNSLLNKLRAGGWKVSQTDDQVETGFISISLL